MLQYQKRRALHGGPQGRRHDITEGGSVLAKKKAQPETWYPMDNAGVLYAAISGDDYSPVYRISAVLDKAVDAAALQRALEKNIPRFPTFHVRLRKGAFWYYFVPDDRPGPFVQEDVCNFCQPMDPCGEATRLLRVCRYENRVSIECFHALSDGGGAMVFFKTLLACYFRELGEDIPDGDGILDVTEPPRPGETEDAYRRYAGGRAAPRTWKQTAYHPTGTPEPFYTLNVTQGLLSVAQVKQVAKANGGSITEYLSAALIWTLMELQRREGRKERPVSLAIPIDLRRFFPTETVRNFILTARPCIDPRLGDYTFPEVMEQVRYQLRLELSRPLMKGSITGNVNFQKNPILKAVPCVLKDPVMKLSYRLAAIRPFSMTYTNPGIFKAPAPMARHIQRVEAVLGQPYGDTVNCASVSCGDALSISFASNLKERDVEREFFRFLVREGLHVKVLSNRSDPS